MLRPCAEYPASWLSSHLFTSTHTLRQVLNDLPPCLCLSPKLLSNIPVPVNRSLPSSGLSKGQCTTMGKPLLFCV